MRFLGTLRCCMYVEYDDQINIWTGYLHRIQCWSFVPREWGVLHCVSYVKAIWSLFSTPANANPPLQSQGEGYLLWLTTKLTRQELAAVWTGRQMQASVCFASRWISTGIFFSPTVRFRPFAAEQWRLAVYWLNGQVFMKTIRETRSAFLLELSHPGLSKRQSSLLNPKEGL